MPFVSGQHANGQNFSGSNVASIATGAFPAGVTAGNFVEVGVTWGGGGVTVGSVKDNNNVALTAGLTIHDPGNNQDLQVFRLWNSPGGATSFTAIFSAPIAFVGIEAKEYDTVKTSADPKDVQEGRTVTNTGTATNAISTSVGGTLTSAADLICATVMSDGDQNDTTISAGTSPQAATLRDTLVVAGSVGMATEDYIQGTAANMRGTFTPNVGDASSSYIVIATAYLPAVAGAVEGSYDSPIFRMQSRYGRQ